MFRKHTQPTALAAGTFAALPDLIFQLDGG